MSQMTQDSFLFLMELSRDTKGEPEGRLHSPWLSEPLTFVGAEGLEARLRSMAWSLCDWREPGALPDALCLLPRMRAAWLRPAGPGAVRWLGHVLAEKGGLRGEAMRCPSRRNHAFSSLGALLTLLLSDGPEESAAPLRLLEYLSLLSGYRLLSALQEARWSPAVFRGIARTPPGWFPKEDWERAAAVLTKGRPQFQTAQAAKAFILEHIPFSIFDCDEGA